MMKAGTYWIGDLCYVMHDEWDEVCNITISGHSVKDGEFKLADGREFATYCTAYGDGMYSDQDGNVYGVDAGLIGCILLSDINQSNKQNNITLGRIVTINHEFHTGSNDGKITFGHVAIDTDPEFEDEDEYDREEEINRREYLEDCNEF